jgi:hypothetical protein
MAPRTAPFEQFLSRFAMIDLCAGKHSTTSVQSKPKLENYRRQKTQKQEVSERRSPVSVSAFSAKSRLTRTTGGRRIVDTTLVRQMPRYVSLQPADLQQGTMVPDYEGDFWADHDENGHGIIDSEEMREECPEGFTWNCCDKLGSEAGCQLSHHQSNPESKKGRGMSKADASQPAVDGHENDEEDGHESYEEDGDDD